jgi:hypothetical protein
VAGCWGKRAGNWLSLRREHAASRCLTARRRGSPPCPLARGGADGCGQGRTDRPATKSPWLQCSKGLWYQVTKGQCHWQPLGKLDFQSSMVAWDVGALANGTLISEVSRPIVTKGPRISSNLGLEGPLSKLGPRFQARPVNVGRPFQPDSNGASGWKGRPYGNVAVLPRLPAPLVPRTPGNQARQDTLTTKDPRPLGPWFPLGSSPPIDQGIEWS